MNATPDAALDALWSRLLDDFDDDARHAAFLAYAAEAGRLVEAATRYRQAAADGARAPRAEKQLAVVTAMALAKLERPRSVRPRRRSRVPDIVVAVLVAAALLTLLAYSLKIQ